MSQLFRKRIFCFAGLEMPLNIFHEGDMIKNIEHINSMSIKVMVAFFLSDPEEIMEDPHTVLRVKFGQLRGHRGEARGELRVYPDEEGLCLLIRVLDHRNRDILVLDDPVSADRGVHDHVVVLVAVLIQPVIPVLQKVLGEAKPSPEEFILWCTSQL